MLESLATSLLKTLVVFIFQKSLESGAQIDIEGAPRWYGKQAYGMFCVSTYYRDGLGAVDIAKEKLYRKMEERIRELIQIAIYENFRDVKDPKEVSFLEAVAKDPKLGLYVKSAMQIRNIKYDEDSRTAFVRGCISQESFELYQSRRLKEIRKAVSVKRAEEAIKELEEIEY